MLGWTTLTEGDVCRWIGQAPPEALPRVEEACRRRREELDVCEHGISEIHGDCPDCRAEYRRARIEAFGED
jgi:hypothetical protein